MLKTLQKIFQHNELVFVFLFTLGTLAYINVATGPFIYDDVGLVANNEYIKSFKYIGEYFTSSPRAGAVLVNTSNTDVYRPLATLTYAILYHLFKLNSAPYHLFLILVHVVNSYLIFNLFQKIKFSRIGSLLGAMFFLLHPVQTESVSYISGLPDSFGPLWLLVGLLLFISAFQAKKKKSQILKFIGTCLCFVVAILIKEPLIVFLPLTWLISFYFWKDFKKPQKKIIVIWLGILAVLAATYLALKFTVLEFGAEDFVLVDESVYTQYLGVRLMTFIRILWDYAVLIIYPAALYFQKPYAIAITLFTPKGLACLGGLVAAMVGAFLSSRKKRQFFFVVAWFFLAMIPYSGIMPVNAIYYEHWLYVPLVGIAVIVPLIYDSFKIEKWKKGFLAVLLIIFCIYFVRTTARNQEWADPYKFYENEIAYSPTNGDLYNQLGNLYYGDAKYEEAKKLYESALYLGTTSNSSVMINLAQSHYLLGDTEAAFEYAHEALAQNPNFPFIYSTLSDLYEASGDKELAQEYQQKYEEMVDF